jgi:hypothetical protein
MYSATDIGRLARSVSGFGNLRVKAWLAAHRSLTQPSHVLLRLSTPKHPPDTLSNLTTFLARISSRGIKLTTRFLLPHHPEMSKIARSSCLPRDAAGQHEFRMARNHAVGRSDGMASSHPFIISSKAQEALPAGGRRPPWWRRQGSNLRPPACKAGALPTELRPRMHHGGPVWTRTTDLTLIRRTL